jgi:hypothetical protein
MHIIIAAAPKHPANGNEAALLLLGSAFLLCLGIVAVVLLVRARRRRAAEAELTAPEKILGNWLLSMLAPEFREYLQRSSPTTIPDEPHSELEALIERAAYISLRRAPRRSVASTPDELVDEMAVGLALLESRLADLTATVARIEQASIGQDKLVWTVLGVLGALVGLLAGVVGLVAGIAKLVG